MATEPIMVQYTSGQSVYFRFFDPVANKTFDFNDDTWQSSPVNPKLAATEQTLPGDADESIYTATIDLSLLNSTASVRQVLAQALDDLATDAIISSLSMDVASGVIPAPTASSDVTLDAVNEMLEAIGEAPVDALDTGGVSAAARAETILARTGKRVQHEGWYDNVETVTYTPDGDSHITPGSDILAIVATGDERVSIRNGRLYDLDNLTDEFSGDLECQVVRWLAYSDLPLELQEYVIARAMIEFYGAMLGHRNISRELYDRRDRAMYALCNAQHRRNPVGMLDSELAGTIIGCSTTTSPTRD